MVVHHTVNWRGVIGGTLSTLVVLSLFSLFDKTIPIYISFMTNQAFWLPYCLTKKCPYVVLKRCVKIRSFRPWTVLYADRSPLIAFLTVSVLSSPAYMIIHIIRELNNR